MLGNISKKKGDNGDFYTKPVVDKKIKETETATRAYTDETVTNAKNDVYTDVSKMVNKVEETVKTKLDTKVDKVSGKSLIDSDVADKLSYDSRGKNIVLQPNVGLYMNGGGWVEADGFSTPEGCSVSGGALVGRQLTVENGTGDIPGLVNIEAKDGDVTANVCINSNSGEYKLHKLSEKANAADIGELSDLTTTDKSSIVAAINEAKTSDGISDVSKEILNTMTYDNVQKIISSEANIALTDLGVFSGYAGSFRGDIRIGMIGRDKWAYKIGPTTGFSTTFDVTCTKGNKIHSLEKKADASDVITKTNTTEFTPTDDYQPATKKYVDDLINSLRLDLGLE